LFTPTLSPYLPRPSIAWALATSDYPALKFFAAVETNLWQLIDDSSTQEISSLIWSFAKLQIPTPGLFKKIEQRSQFLVANGTEQSISNTAWAFAKMNYDCAELFEEIDKKAKEIVKNGNPQSISNIAWALGTLQVSKPLLAHSAHKGGGVANEGPCPCPKPLLARLVALKDRLVSCRRNNPLFARRRKPYACNPARQQLLRSRMCAFARRHKVVAHNPTLQLLLCLHMWRVLSPTPFPPLQYDGQKFMNEVNNNSDWVGTANASTQAVANVALAFAELGIEGDKFFEKVEDEVEWFLREGKDQHISNLCWSLSILGLSAKRETLLQRLWDRLRIGGTGSEVFRTSDVLQVSATHSPLELKGRCEPSCATHTPLAQNLKGGVNRAAPHPHLWPRTLWAM